MSRLNLLKNSNALDTWYISTRNITTRYTDNEGFSCCAINPTSVAWWSLESKSDATLIPYSLVRNKTITVSVEVKSSDYEALNADTAHGLRINPSLCTASSNARTKYASKFLYTTVLSDKWTRISATFTITDSALTSGSGTINPDTDRFFVSFYNYSSLNMEFRKPKLEIGSAATEWRPNVLDVDFHNWLYTDNQRQDVTMTVYGVNDTFTLSGTDIIAGSLSLDRYSVSGDKVEIGSAIAGELTFTVDNADGRFNDTVFAGAEVYVQLQIADWEHDPDTIYTRELGYFKIDSAPRKLSTIKLTALDRMCKFDTVADVNTFIFPMTVGYLVDKICTDCGVTLDTDISGLPNYGYEITKFSTDNGETITYRTLLQWCAALMGVCAQINASGNLELKWYESDSGVTIHAGNRYSSDIYEEPISITGLAFSKGDDFNYHIGRVQEYSRNYATGTQGLEIVESGGTVANGKWNKTSGGGTVANIVLTDSPDYDITQGVRITKTVRNDQIGICQNGLHVKSGEHYTLSAWVKPNRAGVKAYLLAFFGGGVQGENLVVPLENKWQRVSVSGVVSQDATTNIGYIHVASTTDNEVECYIDVCGVKLEKGDTATPWNPAPADSDYSFYSLDLSSVGILQTDTVKEAMTALMDKLKTFSYIPYSATIKPMPWLNPMDRVTVIDRSGDPIDTIITNVQFNLNRGMSIAGKGETEESNNYSSSTTLTAQQIQIVEAVRKTIDSSVSAAENSLIEMNRLIANSLGLYMIEETETNGSKKYYFCNASTLQGSSIIYTFNANGIAWTDKWNNGSPVWKYGITKDGNAILNMIALHKLSADVITTGVLTSRNENAKIDLDNGTILMNSGSINLGDKFTVDNNGNMKAVSGNIGAFSIADNGLSYFNASSNTGMDVDVNGLWHYKATSPSSVDDADYYADDVAIERGVRLKNGHLEFYGTAHDGTASAVNGGFNRSKTLYGAMYQDSTSDIARVNAEGFYHFQRGLPWLIKSGTVTVTTHRSDIVEEEIQFNEPFPYAPKVVAGIYSTTSSVMYRDITLMVSDVTQYGFTLRVANANSNSAFVPAIHWIATVSDERYLPVRTDE